jgi:hypothetical protein
VRIRIGDIEIDGQDVRIGGGASAPQTYGPQTYGPQTYGPQTYGPQTHAPQAPPTALVPQATSLAASRPGSLKMLPVRGKVLIQFGAVLLLAGILLFAAAPPASILSFLLHVLPLTLGGGTLGLGVMKRLEEGRERQAARLLVEAEIAPHVERILGVLREPRAEQTVEWIVAKLQLPEATVVRVLDRLRKQGDIEEELNVDNGEWYYFVRPDRSDTVRGDLESRLAALESRKTE